MHRLTPSDSGQDKGKGIPANTNGQQQTVQAGAPAPKTAAPAQAAAQQQNQQASQPAAGSAYSQQRHNNGNQSFQGTSMNSTPSTKPSLARSSNLAPISRHQSSAAMDNIRKAIEELSMAAVFDQWHLTVIELDRNSGTRNISVLIVCAAARTSNNQPPEAVAYHTLLLEETGTPVTRKRRMMNNTGAGGFTANGGMFEEILYPSDGFDDYMRVAVREAVAKKFGNGPITVDQNSKLIAAGSVVLLDAMASTVPSTIDLSKVGNVRGAVSNGATASTTILRTFLGTTEDFKLEGDVSAQRWTTSILVSDAAFSDVMGLPMRGDVVLELREGGNDNANNNNMSYNDPAGEVLTHQTLGFQDLVYQPSQAAQMAMASGIGSLQGAGLGLGMGLGMGMGMGGGIDPSVYHLYRSRYVITNLDPIYNPTLPDTLMGLATTYLTVEEKRWQQLWVKRHMLGAANPINGKNMHDLGALGLDVTRPGVGEQAGQLVKGRWPTTGAKGEEGMLFSILNTVTHPDSFVSMDVSETGTFSWITGVFASAALGSMDANEEIVGAADYVTRGNFSKIYAQLNGGAMPPVMLNDGVLVNMGRYVDGPGSLRDVREVDQLVIHNAFGETAPDMVDRWIRVNYDTTIDEEFRLVEQRAIISQLFTSATFTGRARRVTFHPAFLLALNKAIAACGGRFMARWGNEAPQSTNRATATFLNGVNFGMGQSGAFTQSYRPAAAGVGLGGGGFGRWRA